MWSTDASSSLQWYLYQKLVALYLACRFLVDKGVSDDELEQWYLSIEIGWDDVVITKGELDTTENNFTTKEEIHLFQTKYTKSNTCNYHQRAIRQLYLNKKLHEDRWRSTIYVNFITKRPIKKDSKKYCFNVTNTSTELPIIDCLNDWLSWCSIDDFPSQYSSLNFPVSFNVVDYPLSNIVTNTNEFQSLSIAEIEEYLQRSIPVLNSTVTNWNVQIEKLYYKLTQKIFDGKYISFYEIKSILSQSLTQTLDELISNWTHEWKFQLKRDQFLRKVWDLFNIKSILSDIKSTVTYNPDDIVSILSERFNDLNSYIKKLSETDFNDFLYNLTLKDIISINNSQDLIDFGSKNIPEDIVNKWLKTYFNCYIRCDQKSFNDKFLITGIDGASIQGIIKESLLKLYHHHDKKIIWCYKYNYYDDFPYIEFNKDELDRVWITSKKYIDQSQLITKPYKVSICCMKHICDSWLSEKFRHDKDKCEYCKTPFNSSIT